MAANTAKFGAFGLRKLLKESNTQLGQLPRLIIYSLRIVVQ